MLKSAFLLGLCATLALSGCKNDEEESAKIKAAYEDEASMRAEVARGAVVHSKSTVGNSTTYAFTVSYPDPDLRMTTRRMCLLVETPGLAPQISCTQLQ